MGVNRATKLTIIPESIYTQNSGKTVMRHVPPGLVAWLKRLSQIGGGSLRKQKSTERLLEFIICKI